MILALDIGGTKIAVGTVSKTGVVVSRETFATPANGGKFVVDAIMAAIARHKTPKTKAIGLAIAGQIDSARGVVRSSPNLKLIKIPLRSIVTRKFHLPVAIENDARCFTVGEAVYGAGRGHKSVFGVTIGTGIGGGFVLEKKAFRGATDSASEIGHLVIDTNAEAPICSCGKRGHLEAYASGWAMLKEAKKQGCEVESILELERAYSAKEKIAISVVSQASRMLAIGLTNILTGWNPDCVVLGGGLVKFHPFWKSALKIVPSLVPFEPLSKTPILPSKLGNEAALVGAATLVSHIKK